ncbi:hypothetical protein B0H16DRAFT_1335402, partial [Mycena metata]
VDNVTTYDIACEYIIKLESRFKQNFPDLVEMVKSEHMRWGVPSLHVQGHQDSCNYFFGTVYMECVGHFHGETAEHYCTISTIYSAVVTCDPLDSTLMGFKTG